MTHIAPLLLLTLILTSSLLGLGAAETSVLCAWSKVLSNGEVHYSFLRRGSPSVRLYHSAWSGQERALLSCAWSDDAAVIHNYFSLCLERAHEFSDEPDENFDVESMIGGEEQNSVAQNSQGQDERSEVKIHKRVKRGFIVPGTLWCGSGNKAPSYADLGVFAETDSCCREHDQCKYTILSFQSEFGVFNSNIFTMSHCDCDNKFHSCLMEANDSIADVVGYTFFNLLKMHCFEFSHRLQCTERNWFGMCKETKMALYADVHPPTLYESEVSINSTSSNANATIPADPQLFSITAAASTVPTPYSLSRTSLQHLGLFLYTKITKPNMSLDASPSTEMQLSCGVYKDLDECRNKILPQQRRYGLHNPEPRTLYHCNCTISCTAVLVRADLPPLEQGSSAEVEEQHHLQAVRLTLRRQNTRRAKRKDRAVKLHRLCLRMTRPKQKNKTRKHGQNAQQPAVRGRELV
uniref:phospholipase A2 n=1 Tax=Seriola dumerili TaxID=41447 RepID=A0A3B4VP47_SERDU